MQNMIITRSGRMLILPTHAEDVASTAAAMSGVAPFSRTQ